MCTWKLVAVLLLAATTTTTQVMAIDSTPTETWGRAPSTTQRDLGIWQVIRGKIQPWCDGGGDTGDNKLVFKDGDDDLNSRRLETENLRMTRAGVWRWSARFAAVGDSCSDAASYPMTQGQLALFRDRRTNNVVCPGMLTGAWREERRIHPDRYVGWTTFTWRQTETTICSSIRFRWRHVNYDAGSFSTGDDNHLALDDLSYDCVFHTGTGDTVNVTRKIIASDDFQSGSASSAVWAASPPVVGDCASTGLPNYACFDGALAARSAQTNVFDGDDGLILRFDVFNHLSRATSGEDLYLEYNACAATSPACWDVLYMYEGAYMPDAWTPYSSLTKQEFWLPAINDGAYAFRWRQALVNHTDAGPWAIDNIEVSYPLPVAGGAGYALAFKRDWHNTGIGYVELSTGSNPDAWARITDALTVEAWVRVDAASNSFVRRLGASAGEVDFAFDFDDGVGNAGFVPRLTLTNVALEEQQVLCGGAYTVTAGEWTHVAWTYDNTTTVRCYVNGQLAGTATASFTGSPWLRDSAGYLIIGADRRSGSPTKEFAGAIDELRIWSKARTPEEIARYADATLDRSYQRNSLVLYHRFDGVNCDMLYDQLSSDSDASIWGHADWVLSGASLNPAVETVPEQAVNLVLSGTHPHRTQLQLVYTLTSLPGNGTLSDGGAVVTSVPAQVSPQLRFTPAAECTLACDTSFTYTVQYSSGSRGTIVSVASATQKIRIQAGLDLGDDKQEATAPEAPPDIIIDDTLLLILLGIMFLLVMFGAAVGVGYYREAQVKRRNDKFRKLYESPKFTVDNAFVGEYQISDSLRSFHRNKKRVSLFWDLEELLTLREHVVVHAIFEEMPVETSDDIVRAVVYLAEGSGQALGLFQSFVVKEVTAASYLPREEAVNTLFRGYSVTSKMWSGYAKMGFGLNYLHTTLSDVLYEICNRHSGRMEIDSQRVNEGKPRGGGVDLATNKFELLADAQRVFNAIKASHLAAPPHLRFILRDVFNEVGYYFSDDKYSVVGQFLFLRFFCPAIAVPESYGLLDEDPADEARRLLVLIAKVLQNLAAGVTFGMKEEHMISMNSFIEGNTDGYRAFVDRFICMDDLDEEFGDIEVAMLPYALPKDVQVLSRSILHEFVHHNRDAIRHNIGYKGSMEQVSKVQKELARLTRKLGKPKVFRIDSDSEDDD